MMAQERDQGLFQALTYKKFSSRIFADRNRTLERLLSIKNKNPRRPIIGVGAAAKANTWLNYHAINHLLVDYITDSSPHKQGKFTPLSRIPIVDDEVFAQYDRPLALVLSWNINDQLKANIKKINKNTEFINI